MSKVGRVLLVVPCLRSVAKHLEQWVLDRVGHGVHCLLGVAH